MTNWQGNDFEADLSQFGLPTSFGRPKNTTSIPTREAEDELLLIHKQVKLCFEKKFSFERNCDCFLPKPYFIYKEANWKIDSLQEMKKELNSVKNKLNLLNLDLWHKHTKYTNRAGGIPWKLKNHIHPELLTQAWTKFYEIVSSFPLISVEIQNNTFNSVHLCEAPGAFIASLNHYLKIHHPTIKWDWRATTLNPYYEGNPLSNMINDDRFILNTINKWNFGADFTGNLMNHENMNFIVKNVKQQLGRIMLVTADGSIDCQNNPGEQENQVSPLHFWETFTALQILETGGSFVMKMFTLFESDSCCLINFLWNAFNQIHVFKPATSKEGNSEIYFICLDYKGIDFIEPWLTPLKTFYEKKTSENAILPKESLCPYFVDQLLSCAEFYKNFQIEAIDRNINLFKTRNRSNDFQIKRIRHLVAELFFTKYSLTRISSKCEIVGKQHIPHVIYSTFEQKSQETSFLDKKMKENLPPMDQLYTLRNELNDCNISWPHDENVKWFKMINPRADIDLKFGKPLSRIESSKFCESHLLEMKNRIFDLIIHKFGIDPSSIIKNHDYLIEDEILNSFKKQHKILDFHMTFSMGTISGRYQRSQDVCFFKLNQTISELNKDDSIIINGFPILTQFNLAVIYILGHLFEKVGFTRPRGQLFSIIFCNYNDSNNDFIDILKKIDSDIHALSKRDISVLGFLNIKDLCEFCPSPEFNFYSWLIVLNNVILKENLLDILNITINLIET